jgi:hypothetical protein
MTFLLLKIFKVPDEPTRGPKLNSNRMDRIKARMKDEG